MTGAATVLLLGLVCGRAMAQGVPDHLAGETVLIVRHAEKPAMGSGLTKQGEARARAYVHYFEPFREGGYDLKVDALYTGADSANSVRPRLTLEPLSQATGLALHAVDTKRGDELVAALRTEAHGHTPLIAWRHGQIPALLKAFGASAEKLLPHGVWPDDVFDNVIVLHFDSAGRLDSERLVHETLQVANQ